MQGDEEESGGRLAAHNELLAQYQTSRIRSFWTYKRIFQLTKHLILTVDPIKFSVTNTFPYNSIQNITIDEKSYDQFSFDYNKVVYVYSCTYRMHLLCHLFECISKYSQFSLKSIGPFDAIRLKKNGEEHICKISVATYGLLEFNSQNELVQEYKWFNLSDLGFDDTSYALYFKYSGRLKIFQSPSFNQILNSCKAQLHAVGVENVLVGSTRKLSSVMGDRIALYSSIPVAVSSFEVNKRTRRASRPLPRQIHISEQFILETDAAGFQAVSFHKISSIYALVRSWNNARDFTIEFDDETSSAYSSTQRDTLLAMLLDICRASGNLRVTVTGEVSDGLRLMPRFAEESYQATIKDAFFGSTSIETWYLTRLSKMCKQHVEVECVVDACAELNANIQCPGVSTAADPILIRSSLTGTLVVIQNEMIKSAHSGNSLNAHTLSILLQTLYRIVPCVHGFKSFVEVKEVDTRQLLYHLLRYDNDFINYWTLEILMSLCRCPILPRNMQQEFVNKHTLLSNEALISLMDLISSRVCPITFIEQDTNGFANSEEILNQNVGGATESDDNVFLSVINSIHFVPNSLVVIGAASLLESVICSRKDTTSPELLQQILKIMAERSDMLIAMLRSNSFLIMENAAILMYIVMKHQPSVALMLKEAALCEGLVLKHFFTAVFSSSSSQRFISRFLVATWMNGPRKINPAKELLHRMIPHALIEYLKFDPISEEHRFTLDAIEEEFYGANSSQPQTVPNAVSNAVGSLIQQRMRSCITGVVLKDGHARPSEILSVTTGKAKQPENYRVMFHMITQDHKLPDLIWNEQTRLELRGALQHEIKEYDREQRLQGSKKVAWNYQQFEIKYDSLQDEMKVGSVYVRYFLDAGDTFLRSLENPNHLVLFEKLFRRILVNIESNPSVAILCTKCLSRLYSVCRDLIGGFDDMIIIVRMLEQARNLELKLQLLDLLLCLAEFPANLQQLLEKHVVDVVIQFVSLAHINPDQIGNLLARAVTQSLLLQNSESINNSTTQTNEDSSCSTRQSVWIPNDGSCPKVWFAAPPTTFPPSKLNQKGPFRVSELLMEIESGRIPLDWIAAADITAQDSDDQSFQVHIDTGAWKVISEIFQLQLQLLFTGTTIHSPAQVSCKGLQLLLKISTIHKSANFQGIPFFPLPMSKMIMSEPHHLSVFAQLILSNDSYVVDTAAHLIKSLVELNSHANAKLYLTGLFFFAARYSGNNYRAISELFSSTHLKQSFHDTASSVARELPLHAKSILTTIFPAAMVSILHNYGAERFAAIHIGDFDTPEVIWNAKLRHHLVQMVDQHLADFPARLRQFTLARYEYCPIAKVHYPLLDTELYVHEYYLRNLCDEQRFPDWPIVDPLTLLRECLERWQNEMAKNNGDFAVEEAKAMLKLPAKFSNSDLRKAYKNLARTYHPDKNPNGRDLFEQIHIAYELLCSYELKELERNDKSVILLLKTQLLLYRRYPNHLSDQKYPCYGLLISTMPLSLDSLTPFPEHLVLSLKGENRDPEIESDQIQLMLLASSLLHYTTLVSSLNARELSSVDGALQKVYQLFKYISLLCCQVAPLDSNVTSDGIQPASPSSSQITLCHEILLNLVRTYDSVAATEEGRESLYYQLVSSTSFIQDICSLSSAHCRLPLVVEVVLEFISRCCSSPKLQLVFSRSGILWKVIPLLLNYDSSFEVDSTDLQIQKESFSCSQQSSNCLAILSARVLGRLGGFMFEDLKTENNVTIKTALSKLLTPSIAVLLRNRQPMELLNTLNCNIESPTRIWNLAMRQELLDYIMYVDQHRATGMHETDLLQVKEEFVFSNLKNELFVGNVYLRIFNQSKSLADIENVSFFCSKIIEFIGCILIENYSLELQIDIFPQLGSSQILNEEIFTHLNTVQSSIKQFYNIKQTATLTPSECSQLDTVIESLEILFNAAEYTIYDFMQHPHGLFLLFLMLNIIPIDGRAFSSLSKILLQLSNMSDFIIACMSYRPPIVWRFLKCLCNVPQGLTSSAMTNISQLPHISVTYSNLWNGAEAFAAHADGLTLLLQAGLIVRILGVLLAVDGYHHSYSNRLRSISLVTKCLWNPVHGGETSSLLRRFLPEPLVILLKRSIGKSSLQLIDTPVENPELIWTEDMQNELRQGIVSMKIHASKIVSRLMLLDEGLRTLASSIYEIEEHIDSSLSPHSIRYSQLENEIYLGNVYIRVFLKQPTYKLTNPIYFLEKVIEQFDYCFNLQVPKIGRHNDFRYSTASSESSALQLIIGKEDFLSVLISCAICCLKNEHSLIDQVIQWGFAETCIQDYFYRINYYQRTGMPLVSNLRFLNECMNFMEFNDYLISYTASSVSTVPRKRERNHHGSNNIIFHLTFALVAEPLSVENGSWQEIISERANVMLYKECFMIVEILRKLFSCYQHNQIIFLVQLSLNCYLPNLLLNQLVNKSTEAISYLTNSSTVKFHSIEVLKLMLRVANTVMKQELQVIFSYSKWWNEYKDQNHDLFITVSSLQLLFPFSKSYFPDKFDFQSKDRMDHYLIEDSSDRKFAGLLKDIEPAKAVESAVPKTAIVEANLVDLNRDKLSRYNSFEEFLKFVSKNLKPVNWIPTSSQELRSDNEGDREESFDPASGKREVTSSSQLLKPVTSLGIEKPLVEYSERTDSEQPRSKENKIRAASEEKAANVQIVVTSIEKGSQGLGLDLAKTQDGRACVLKLKDFLNGTNPAAVCIPPILTGDVIVAVNGRNTGNFLETVNLIRSAAGTVQLTLLRSSA